MTTRRLESAARPAKGGWHKIVAQYQRPDFKASLSGGGSGRKRLSSWADSRKHRQW